MNKPSDYLVAIDLDGTLLDESKGISEQTKDYLGHLQNRGVKICLASGRPYRAMKKYYDELGLNSLVICGNGALIVDPMDNDKVIYRSIYPIQSILKCIDVIGEDAFDLIMIEDGNKLFLNREKEDKDDFIWTNGMEVYIGNQFKKATSPDGAILRVKNEEDKYKLISESQKDPYIGIRFWGKSLIGEFFLKNINKATALEKVCDYYQVDIKNSIAFGDDVNDLEMIMQAGTGVCMNNGAELVGKYSDLLSIDDNSHDGVKETLKLLLHGI